MLETIRSEGYSRRQEGAREMKMTERVRVALFGSFYRGFYLGQELLTGPFADRIELVGVATDDPKHPFVNPGRRVWQYPHHSWERDLVPRLAKENGLTFHTGRIQAPEFRRLFFGEWKPELCLMGTFGQRIDPELFMFPKRGFFNFHPSDGGEWPSRYAGGNPFFHLLQDGVSYCSLTMHQVDAGFDTGKLLAVSAPVAIPPGVSVVDLHKLTSPLAAVLLREQLPGLLFVR